MLQIILADVQQGSRSGLTRSDSLVEGTFSKVRQLQRIQAVPRFLAGCSCTQFSQYVLRSISLNYDTIPVPDGFFWACFVCTADATMLTMNERSGDNGAGASMWPGSVSPEVG